MFRFPQDFPQISDIRENAESPDYVVLNGQRYMFVAILDNGKTNKQIPNKYINTFVLSDPLLGFEQIGHLTYRDPYFTIRSFFSKLNIFLGEDCIKEEEEDPDFSFTSNGSERLHIKMCPIYTDDDEVTLDRNQKGDHFLIQTFVITDFSNQPDSLANKIYRLSFEGIETHILKNTRLTNFNCGRIGRKDGVVIKDLPAYAKSKNECQAALTGEGIYQVIRDAFLQYTSAHNFDLWEMLPTANLSDTEVMVLEPDETKGRRKRWDNNGKLTRGDKNSYDVWDWGLSFLYTLMGSKDTAYDLVMQFLEYHCSAQNSGKSETLDGDTPSLANINYDPCILKVKRPDAENRGPQITLRPFVSYFENIGGKDFKGDEYMDTFYIKDEGVVERALGIAKGFLNTLNFCDDEGKIRTTANPITEFSFEPISPTDSNNFMVSHIVLTEADCNKVYNNKDGDYVHTKKYIAEKYISYFDKVETKDKFKLINVIDPTGVKDANVNPITTHTTVCTDAASIALGRNKLINYLIFMNDAISFRVEGIVNRQAGQFFSVDMFGGGSDPDDDIANRLFGIYWATDITHEIDFRDKTYVNNITGTKFYKYRASKSLEETINFSIDPNTGASVV